MQLKGRATAENQQQATLDARVFNDIIGPSLEGTGWGLGCAVTAQGTPDMTVAVAAGVCYFSAVEASVSSGGLTIAANTSGDPRIDLICVASDGTKSVVQGTPATEPDTAWPDPAGKVVLAAIYVPDSITAISNAKITDVRLRAQVPDDIYGIWDAHKLGLVGGAGSTDDGPALRAALVDSRVVDQSYPAGLGGGISFRLANIYKIGEDGADKGIDITNLAGLSLVSEGGAGWGDQGDIGTTLKAGSADMTLVYHRPGSGLNHHGVHMRGLNLSNIDGLANVKLLELTDVNKCVLEQIRILGSNSPIGIILNQLNVGADNAYHEFKNVSVRLEGSSAVAWDLIAGFGCNIWGGNIDMETGGIGMRIGNWYQELKCFGTKWNHDGRHVVSEGGRLYFSGAEFEGYSSSERLLDFLVAASSPSPFSGQAVRLHGCNITGNNGDELGLRTGSGVTGKDDMCLFSNLLTDHTNNSGAGWVVGDRF